MNGLSREGEGGGGNSLPHYPSSAVGVCLSYSTILGMSVRDIRAQGGQLTPYPSLAIPPRLLVFV